MALPNEIDAADLPDFLIIGAMKAGTSSMHHLLGSHPGVFIPDGEIFFFDLDELECHHDFPVGADGEWIDRDFEKNFEEYLPWYRSFFEEAPGDALVGEDSTTYAVSKLAPERISEVLGDVKLIHMMRHPADRAYSHYWHLLRTGRATKTFEDRLRTAPHGFMKYGYYRENLERYLEYFDRSQLKCVVFERFVERTQTVVDEVCDHLGVDAAVDVAEAESHQNRAKIPKMRGLKRYLNDVDPTREEFRYNSHLPGGPDKSSAGPGPIRQLRRAVHGVLDDVTMIGADRSYPPMEEATRQYLTSEFKRHNRGLSSLVGRDLSEWWEDW